MAKKHPMAKARAGKRGGYRVKHTGGWGKKVKRKSKKSGKKRASKKSSKKRASKKVGRPKHRASVRKVKSRKRKTTTTTFKASGLKVKMKCPPGKMAVSSAAKAAYGGRTYTAISGRCIPILVRRAK